MRKNAIRLVIMAGHIVVRYRCEFGSTESYRPDTSTSSTSWSKTCCELSLLTMSGWFKLATHCHEQRRTNIGGHWNCPADLPAFAGNDTQGLPAISDLLCLCRIFSG